jgi:hypothetical protein
MMWRRRRLVPKVWRGTEREIGRHTGRMACRMHRVVWSTSTGAERRGAAEKEHAGDHRASNVRQWTPIAFQSSDREKKALWRMPPVLLEGSTSSGGSFSKEREKHENCPRRFKRPNIALFHPTHSTLGDDSVRSGPKCWDRAKRAKSLLDSSLPSFLPSGRISSTGWAHTITGSKGTSYPTIPGVHGKGRDDATRLKRRPFSVNVQQEFEARAR